MLYEVITHPRDVARRGESSQGVAQARLGLQLIAAGNRSQGGAVTYALLQEVVDPPGACQPDRREPNGSYNFV